MDRLIKPIIIIGKSGSGKDTTAQLLKTKYGFDRVIEYTTRKKRTGEIDGVEYHFITDEVYDDMLNNNEFIADSTFERVQDGDVCKVRYGIKKSEIIPNTIISTNPSSMIKIKSIIPDAIVVYIFVPGYIRTRRLRERGDNRKEIERRLITDGKDFNDEVLSYVDISISNGISYTLDYDEKSPDVIASEILEKVIADETRY